MTDDIMAQEALRLRDAVLRAVPGSMLPGGASDTAIAVLDAGWPGLHVPSELTALLRVMDGSGDAPVLLTSLPLLGAEAIVAETRSRDLGEDIAFCPGWVVIASEGWGHVAVTARALPCERSAVVDLSYGNQAYPVETSSLTALVAASADAWERGLHPSQEGAAGEGDAQELRAVREALLRERSAEYPSPDGLTAFDQIAFWRIAWPADWPGRDEPELMGIYVPDSLADALARRGAHSVIDVQVTQVEGRWLRVEDGTSQAWLDVPPGLAAGRDVALGARVLLSVLHANPWPLPPPPDGSSEPALRVTGVVGTRGGTAP